MSRPRIDPAAGAVIRAVRTLAGGGVVAEAESVPWESLTFRGARHRIALRCADEGIAARLARLLPEHEFALDGHIVADLADARASGDMLRFSALTVVAD
ncbi:hypothetical protein [Sphingomonas quercus]|uniref:Uncharacterized protein n=1 Tax=Sphingomonas quercus TaxID=2842451 RepID=A0ABS6BJP9_9SPHN|nr:hypothetical protein [Sphingomonas quercus]MBU3077425.1 hypothetical protein [Sphingomonas quercus]